MSNVKILQTALVDFGRPERRFLYLDLYSPDIALHGYVGVDTGIESVREYYERFWMAFPDAELEPLDFLEEGSSVAIRYVVHGTNTGSWFGREPTGRRIALPGISILRFRVNKCYERWVATDSLEFLRQLKILPG